MINFNSGTEYYTYDGNGNRVRKDVNGAYTEYQYLNGQPIAERHSDGTWSDYIYANGQKIAKADTYDKALRLSGTSTGAGGYSWFHLNGDGGLAGYTIQSGDTLYLRDFQSGPINGAIAINMTDGTNIGGLTDQDGYPAGADSFTGDWHLRRIDLTPMAGHTIGQVFFGATYNQNGDWQESFADAALFGADGTVHPLYTGQPTANVSLTWQSNMTNLSADVASYGTFQNTFYYISDQIGSTRMMMNGGSNGWPVGQDEYYPFGQKTNNNLSAAQNAYLFTGLERDGESGLDHATFRQYTSTQGRWISPDPSSGSYDFSNPQSFNRYTYVGNNPLGMVDPSGLSGVCVNAFPYGTAEPNQYTVNPWINNSADCSSAYGTWVETGSDVTVNVSSNDPDPGSVADPGVGAIAVAPSSSTSTGSTSSAPNKMPTPKPTGCMVVNGRTVCPSPIDKYNFLHPGQTNYRDSNSRCSLHVTVNNTTGQVNSHIDEFNPNDYFLNHVILDVVPDVIYDITGRFLFPTGNQFCQ